jgi:alanine dehydrogenase
MLIGIPKEIKDHEYRVAITPELVRRLSHNGHRILIEENAGKHIGFTDKAYAEAGAHIVSSPQLVYEADLIVKVKEPQEKEFQFFKKNQLLFCYLHLAAEPRLTEELQKRGVIAIAYETVTDKDGKLPLLHPMSEIAGRISIQVGAVALQLNNGGSGVLLGGVPGVPPGKVLVIGGGVVGTEAARMAIGLGASVTIMDTNLSRLRELDALFGPLLKTTYSTESSLEEYIRESDLVVGSVLIPGKRAPKLITRKMLATMSPGSVFVDVAIDQGGCAETSRPTTHTQPTYIEEGVIHYCVTNMPGACAKTSTLALTHATGKYIVALADKGYPRAMDEVPGFRNGLNVADGKIII